MPPGSDTTFPRRIAGFTWEDHQGQVGSASRADEARPAPQRWKWRQCLPNLAAIGLITTSELSTPLSAITLLGYCRAMPPATTPGSWVSSDFSLPATPRGIWVCSIRCRALQQLGPDQWPSTRPVGTVIVSTGRCADG